MEILEDRKMIALPPDSYLHKTQFRGKVDAVSQQMVAAVAGVVSKAAVASVAAQSIAVTAALVA